jgi:hypothetical protein
MSCEKGNAANIVKKILASSPKGQQSLRNEDYVIS